ncbi:MAG: hypothetical protein KDA60_03405 [Planctomycetales bacterium]|nr:hypothetical protein [Planctomycetales bacterium]
MTYTLRQLDSSGTLVDEKRVNAHSYHAALRQLKDAADGAEKIEVYNGENEKAGEISVEYWATRLRQR